MILLFYIYAFGLVCTMLVFRHSFTRLAKYLAGPVPELFGWFTLTLAMLVYPLLARRLAVLDGTIYASISKTFNDSLKTSKERENFHLVYGSEYNYLPNEILEASVAIRSVDVMRTTIFENLRKIAIKGYGTHKDLISHEVEQMIELDLVKPYLLKRGYVFKLTSMGKEHYRVAKKLKYV